jgi:hypothetical protein
MARKKKPAKDPPGRDRLLHAAERRVVKAARPTMAKKPAKKAGPPEERYPHVARWCNDHGWIEVGYEWQDKLFARALNEGGLVWGGEGPYATLDDALHALEEGLAAFMAENGLL